MLNHIIIMGRMVRDPELRSTQSERSPWETTGGESIRCAMSHLGWLLLLGLRVREIGALSQLAALQ